eukprot:IDg18134t1
MVGFGRLALRSVMFAGGAGTVAATVTVKTQPESGISRSLRFWSGAIPVYANYKLVEWRTAAMTDAEAVYRDHYEPLNEKYAPRVEALTLELQGFYYKLAQVVSTRDEFLPDQYMQWAKRLQDSSPRVMAPSEARAVVEKSLGVTIDEVFSEWDDEPVRRRVHRAGAPRRASRERRARRRQSAVPRHRGEVPQRHRHRGGVLPLSDAAEPALLQRGQEAVQDGVRLRRRGAQPGGGAAQHRALAVAGPRRRAAPHPAAVLADGADDDVSGRRAPWSTACARSSGASRRAGASTLSASSASRRS